MDVILFSQRAGQSPLTGSIYRFMTGLAVSIVRNKFPHSRQTAIKAGSSQRCHTRVEAIQRERELYPKTLCVMNASVGVILHILMIILQMKSVLGENKVMCRLG